MRTATAQGDLRAHASKKPVGVVQHLLPDRPALGVVGVEQGRGGVPLEHQGQFPGQVGRVLQARVHALAAGRTVNVGRVAGDEGPALAVLVHAAMMDAIARDPLRVGQSDVQAGGVVDHLLHFVERGRLGAARLSDGSGRYSPLRLDGHDAAQVFALERQINGQVAAAEEKLQVVVIQGPLDLAIGQQELLRVGGAVVAQPQRLADDAVGPVSADQIGGVQLAHAAGGILRLHGHAVGRLRESGHLDVVFHFRAPPAEILDQDVFDIPLRDHEQERIGGVAAADVVQVELADLLAVDKDLRPWR